MPAQKTRDQKGDWIRVAPCLYRYQNTGAYYAVLRLAGKLIRKTLKTMQRLYDEPCSASGLTLEKVHGSNRECRPIPDECTPNRLVFECLRHNKCAGGQYRKRQQMAAVEERMVKYSFAPNSGTISEIGRRLVAMNPSNVLHWILAAYATRLAESVWAAREILRRAKACHPDEPVIDYNLACFSCRLGDNRQAGDFLLVAIRADRGFRAF